MAGVIVTFAPVDGKGASAGRTNSTGTFILISQTGRAGAVPGKHKVLLSLDNAGDVKTNFSDPSVRERIGKERDALIKSGKKGAPAQSEAEKKAAIPPEYANPQKTPLEFEVKPNSNIFDVPVP